MKLNRYVQGMIGIFAVVLIVFVGAKARNAMEEYNYIGKVVRDRDVITIEGMGKVSATPDIAVVSLGVTSEGRTVKEVQLQNTEKMNAIITALKGMGIESKDLQTSNYSISPRYDWSNNRQTIIGYTVSQMVTVKIRNLDVIGDVLAKAGDLGMNQTGGVQFTIDEPQTLQAEARGKAIEDAKMKAEQLAAKLGLRVVKVVTFSEGSQGYPSPVPMYKAMDAAVGGEAMNAPSIESGSLDVIVNVVVTFEVR